MTSINVSLYQTVFKISWSGFIRSIHHFHIHQNAPYLITYQILRPHCFQFSLRYYSPPKRNRRIWLCKILGVHYSLHENTEYQTVTFPTKFP